MELNKLHLHWRTSRYKKITYKSYSLARAYRKDGKNRKEIVLKLGKLSEEDAHHWRIFMEAVKKPNMILTAFDNIEIIRHYKYLELALVNQIWEEWRLDKPFTNNKDTDVELSKIARILTINRCVDPKSKSQVVKWFPGTWLSNMIDVKQEHINTSRIFRELDTIEDCKEQICKHLYELLKKRSPGSIDSVFYDLSSATFTGTNCILMKWGHCKEGYHNHVVLALVVNKDGLPVYWEVLEGNTADSNTIKWLIERLGKIFTFKNITITFDRGMVSDDNLVELENEGYKYISAMDRNQIENIADNIDLHKYDYLEAGKIEQQVDKLEDFTRLNDTTYYREVKIENKRRYILCFNPQLFKDQRNARGKAIENYREYVENLNRELLLAQNSRNEKATCDKFEKYLSKLKLKKILHVSLNKAEIKTTNKNGDEKLIKTYQGIIDPIDQRKLKEAGKLDGFWLLVTNHYEKTENNFVLSPVDAIKPYRDKVIIESAFRDIKSFIEIKPINVWTEKHVKAHFSICVLAYFINRIICMRLHHNKGSLTKNIVTHEKVYEIFSECTVDKIRIKNAGVQGYKRSYIDDKTMELIKRLNLSKIIKDKSIMAAK